MQINYTSLAKNIYFTQLPGEIIDEIQNWKNKCDEIKNHPLAVLRLHENVGSDHNSYQVSVPIHLIENSYWLAYTLRLSADILKIDHRNLFLRKYTGHFDGLDCWINYSYKGNENPAHIHAGILSGVIYLNNEDKTNFPELDWSIIGKKGDMILFPSNTVHEVKVQEKNYERITFAFNIDARNYMPV